MNVQERGELSQLRDCVQNLALNVARLSQAVEPLLGMQEEQNRLRDRIAELEGFRAAVLWLTGLVGAGAIVSRLITLWIGGIGS